MIINYFLPDSIDLFLQFAISFNYICDIIMPDYYTSSGYATEIAI